MNAFKCFKVLVIILFFLSSSHFKKLLRTTKTLHDFNRKSYAEVQESQLRSVCNNIFHLKSIHSNLIFSLMNIPCASDL